MMRKLSNLFLSIIMIIVSIMALSSNITFSKFVFISNGLAWQSYFTIFEQLDDIFVITGAGTSESLYGADGTDDIAITVEEKHNVFGTYFVIPNSETAETRDECFENIVADNKWPLDSIQNFEFNVQNHSATEEDMLITFDIHYYARKDKDGAANLQFAVYNTIYGKISSPFDDNTGRVWKGEFIQVGDGNVFDLTSDEAANIIDPFNEIPNLVLDNPETNKLAVGSSNDSTSFDNYLSIRFGGEDNINYDGVDYCPHHAHINQYQYGAVSTATTTFNGPNLGKCDSRIHWFCSCEDYYYISARRVLSASELSDFIVKNKGSSGFNISVKQGDNAIIDDNCFISAVTLTATPCSQIWSDYVQSGT